MNTTNNIDVINAVNNNDVPALIRALADDAARRGAPRILEVTTAPRATYFARSTWFYGLRLIDTRQVSIGLPNARNNAESMGPLSAAISFGWRKRTTITLRDGDTVSAADFDTEVISAKDLLDAYVVGIEKVLSKR